MADQAQNEHRREERTAKTLFCQILCEGKWLPAVVLDASPSGLFVRTSISPPAGTEIEVTLRRAGGQTWTLQTTVARKSQGRAHDTSIGGRGLGLRIVQPPDGFSDFIATL
jgi:hypothetical protein